MRKQTMEILTEICPGIDFENEKALIDDGLIDSLDIVAVVTELMEASMSKIRDMVDSNTIIGEPIQTPDGVTLIPVSRLSFGFGCGGGDYGKQAPKFGGASTAGVKVEPVAFLVVKDGVTRVMPVALPAVGTVDRVIDLVPQVMDRVESFIDKKKAEKETY